jgi:hypothetical protein
LKFRDLVVFKLELKFVFFYLGIKLLDVTVVLLFEQ